MTKFVINGGIRLNGEVVIGGAKNSTVALIPAAILSETPVTFDNVPEIIDVFNLMEILEDLNITSSYESGRLTIDTTNIKYSKLEDNKIKSLRASYYFMGSLLGRFGKAVVGMPGGDDIGPRPIDQHIKAFEALGAKVSSSDNSIIVEAPESGLVGNHIFFDTVSVGATMNTILAAVTAKGQTILENVAKEPEIIDLATFLNNMGAKIRGVGTNTIKIDGVEKLASNVTYSIIPDRIEAGTYLALAAAIGDGVWVKNVIPEHLESFIAKLREMNVKLDVGEDSIYVYPTDETLKKVQIQTHPYPGFATDLQQPITPLILKAKGEEFIIDTIYPKRTKHIPEFNKMGATIHAKDDVIVPGNINEIHGAEVVAEEIRGGMSLVMMALMASGETTILQAENVLRGYDRIIDKMAGLGAVIKVVED